jgi:hypothetical protein
MVCISARECRVHSIRWVAAALVDFHRIILCSDAGSRSRTGLVDRSADLAGDAFLFVSAADRGKRRHPVEKPCDPGSQTRRPGDWPTPAREHDQIEVDGAKSARARVTIVDIERLRPKARYISPPRVHDAQAVFSRSWIALLQ